MSNRIKDFAITAASGAADDYLAIDGATNNTRKILFSTLVGVNTVKSASGQNLVLGTVDFGPALTFTSATGAATFAAQTSAPSFLAGGYNSVANSGVLFFGNTVTNYIYYDGTKYLHRVGNIDQLTLTSSAATVAGNLTVSGTGTSSVAGNLTLAGAAAPTANQRLNISNNYDGTLLGTFYGATAVAQKYFNAGFDIQTYGSGYSGYMIAGNRGIFGSPGGSNLYLAAAAANSISFGTLSSADGWTTTNPVYTQLVSFNSTAATFSQTTSGTSTTAASIIGYSMGLAQNLFVGGTGNFIPGNANALVLSNNSGGSNNLIRAYNQSTAGQAGIDFYDSTNAVFQGSFGYCGSTSAANANSITLLASGGSNTLRFGAGAIVWMTISVAGVTAFSNTTEATTGGAGSLTTAGGFYAAKKGVFAGGIIAATAALATNATDGFFYMPTCAGTPTGVPTAQTGSVAHVYDTTNNKLYVYNGAWKATAALT